MLYLYDFLDAGDAEVVESMDTETSLCVKLEKIYRIFTNHPHRNLTIPKSKKSTLKGIVSLRKRIKEHQLKILNAIESGKHLQYIGHWEKEIENFKREIMRLEKQLQR